MRIIDADKLKEELRGWLALPNRDNDARDVISHQIAAIDNAPTVDTTCPHCDSGYAQGYSDGYLKGKEERPQGEWLKCQNDMFRCSNCSQADEVPTAMGNPIYNFCPNCGADMRGGK